MRKVMVIDDEPFILMMIEEKLKRAGMTVITLRESKGALDVIKEEQPDLIILDWMMPEVSGIDLCRMIKKDVETSHIPVFLLTAKGQDADKQIGLECGAVMYITKPFSPKALLDMVTRTLNGG
ncbi:MAG TPA: response regulator, partial [Thermodesulfovibrionales bacterium]|nr:response regulator [Thermodesulfovibrionales bacterium]